jgi:hypothetical protein
MYLFAQVGQRMREYTRPLVLIVDDFAMREHTPTQSDDLYDLVSDRAIAAKPLILTSNRAPKDWYPLFPNPVVTESLLDRLINTSPWNWSHRSCRTGFFCVEHQHTHPVSGEPERNNGHHRTGNCYLIRHRHLRRWIGSRVGHRRFADASAGCDELSWFDNRN